MKRLWWGLLPWLIAAAPAVHLRNGVAKWQVGEYAAAIAIWLPLAQAGDGDALFNMGQAYRLGRGVLADRSIAIEYYTKAAQRQNLPAQANLGILLFQAGEKDEALHWLVRAADRGEARAQYVLGVALVTGDGVRRQPALAYAYLLRASSSGITQAGAWVARIELTLSPADRERGAAWASALAAGIAVPSEFAAKPLPPRNPSAPGFVDASPNIAGPNIAGPVIAAPLPPAPIAKTPVKPAKPKPEKRVADTRKPGWHVQLGAYGKQAKADRSWDEIKAAHRKILGKATPVFDADGGVIKLQIGPYPTAAAAREICAKLSVAGRACFVVAS